MLLFLSDGLNKIPLVGSVLKRIVPVVNYKGVYPLSTEQLFEWALLDTFDMFSPAFDSPQEKKEVLSWMESSGFRNVELLTVGHLVARGIKAI